MHRTRWLRLCTAKCNIDQLRFSFAVLVCYGTCYKGLVTLVVHAVFWLSKLFLHSFHCKAATGELSQPLKSSFGLAWALEGSGRCVRKRSFGKRHGRLHREGLEGLEGLGCAQQGILGPFQCHAQIHQSDTKTS